MVYTTNVIPILTSNTSDGVASGSSVRASSSTYYLAFDGSTSTRWSSTSAGVTPCYLQYRWKNRSNLFIITQYSITAFTTANNSPRTWEFQGSNDETNWTTLDTQENISFSASETKIYAFVNTTPYLFYRISITENNGGTYTEISKLEMMATVITDVQLASMGLQSELKMENVQLASVNLQTEAKITDVQLANVGLQVEIPYEAPIFIPEYRGRIMICEYQRTVTAEAGTNELLLNITAHDLNDADMIVNLTRRSTSIAGMERASRKIVVNDDNSLLISDGVPIWGQQAGDEIRLYKYIDRTDLVKIGSLNIGLQTGNKGEASFDLVIPIE
jgi:hypothetical protein